MKHLFWLVPGQLCGRSGPNHEPWDASELQSAGVGAVLSVNNADSVYPDDFAAVDMPYRCIPLAANAPPREGDLELCLARLPQAYDYALNEIVSGRSVMVHCRHGKDRTGLFMAYFLRRHLGLSSKDAIDHVKQVRPIALTATGWEQFAADVLEVCEIST